MRTLINNNVWLIIGLVFALYGSGYLYLTLRKNFGTSLSYAAIGTYIGIFELGAVLIMTNSPWADWSARGVALTAIGILPLLVSLIWLIRILEATGPSDPMPAKKICASMGVFYPALGLIALGMYV